MSSVSVLAQSFHNGGQALERIQHRRFMVVPPDADWFPAVRTRDIP